MRINSIQSTSLNYNRIQQQPKKVVRLKENPPQPQTVPSFKGNGFLIGTGLGLIGGLAVIGITAITGGTALPALLAGYSVAGAGFLGGVAGDKIEDKINSKNKQNKQ